MSYLVASVVVLFTVLACPVGGRVCTRVRSEKNMKTVSYPGECHQSFEASCGWFSFDKCLFNETVPCLKTRNVTVTLYRIVEECCPGYHKNRNQKCVVDSESGSGQKPGDDDDDDDKFFLGISHGAYAGIICGILFVACVALLTAVHYRKRRLQDEKKTFVPADQDAAQRQQMIPLEKTESSVAVAVTT